MNCDDMIALLNWYKATEQRLGEASARAMVQAMLKTATEAGPTGTQDAPSPSTTDLVAAECSAPKGVFFVPPTPTLPPDYGANKHHTLSDREKEILAYIRQGWANKRIARQFDVAEATVKVHMKSILRKIGASNRTQAAIWAMTNVK